MYANPIVIDTYLFLFATSVGKIDLFVPIGNFILLKHWFFLVLIL